MLSIQWTSDLIILLASLAGFALLAGAVLMQVVASGKRKQLQQHLENALKQNAQDTADKQNLSLR